MDRIRYTDVATDYGVGMMSDMRHYNIMEMNEMAAIAHETMYATVLSTSRRISKRKRSSAWLSMGVTSVIMCLFVHISSGGNMLVTASNDKPTPLVQRRGRGVGIGRQPNSEQTSRAAYSGSSSPSANDTKMDVTSSKSNKSDKSSSIGSGKSGKGSKSAGATTPAPTNPKEGLLGPTPSPTESSKPTVSILPTPRLTLYPSMQPSYHPSGVPTIEESVVPSLHPSNSPTAMPSIAGSGHPRLVYEVQMFVFASQPPIANDTILIALHFHVQLIPISISNRHALHPWIRGAIFFSIYVSTQYHPVTSALNEWNDGTVVIVGSNLLNSSTEWNAFIWRNYLCAND